MKAIVIEYEPGVLASLRRMLERARHEVFTAADRKEATAVIDANNDAEIVIIGRGKNHGDCGLIMARYVKGLPGKRKIVMTTGYPDAVFMAGAREIGATVLEKPFGFDALIKAIGS